MNRPPPRRSGNRAQPAPAKDPQLTLVQPTEGPRFVAPQMEFPEVRAELEALKPKCASIDFATREGYEAGKLTIKACTDLRSAIEKKRKELKEPALKWGRQVDDKAKELVGLIEDIEKPLRDAKLLVDRAEEAKRREEERKARAAEEARLRAEREAAEKAARALAEEREALAAERARLEALKGPSNEGAKPEPSGPPPRRTVQAPETEAAESTWPWPIDACAASGCTITVMPVGSAFQAQISGSRRWHGTGNTATQALDLAFERWTKNPAPDADG